MLINEIISNVKLSEGPNDPHIFKAVFLAGGPGSGKSYVAGKLLSGYGLKTVNSDDIYEYLAKKDDLDLSDPDQVYSDKGQEVRNRAKELTMSRQAGYIDGRLGLVIDGTGKDPDKIVTQARQLIKLGYDVAMVFVNTDLETAIKRDAARKRTIGEVEATKYWKEVQRNIGRYQQLFGKNNFLVVDNSEGKDYQAETLRAYRDATKFTNRAPDNPKAQKWIADEKAKAKRS